MAGLVQVKRKTSLTVTETFSVDGSPINVDSGLPTLAATFPDGTALDPLPTVLDSWTGRTTGQYRFVLHAQPEVTWLDYELTGTIGGEAQTLGGRVEWVGEYLFTLGEFRALKIGDSTPFADSAKFPNQRIMDARRDTLDEFTKRLHYSPVPRFAREFYSGDNRASLVVRKQYPRDLLSVTVDGVAQTVGNYDLEHTGILTAYNGRFPATRRRNVIVEYSHGLDGPPGDGSNMAQLRTGMLLQPSQVGTANTWVTADGSSYTYDRAGSRNAAGEKVHFGSGPIADWINEWAMPGAFA